MTESKLIKDKNFNFPEYLHRFACWTAARAVQRRYSAKTKEIQEAIEKTELKKLIENPRIDSPEKFDAFHLKTCNTIQTKLGGAEKTSFGRAAKIVAIYLKTAIVLPDNGESVLAKIIYPPIDRKLLQNLCRAFKDKGFMENPWTELNKEQHQDLIKKMREISPDSFWKIESFWP